LPLGELTKEKVRSLAADLNLAVAEKPESMELCFAGEGDYRDALTDAQTNQAGDITDISRNRCFRINCEKAKNFLEQIYPYGV